MAARRDFLSQPAPENYVAGAGRGAMAFTTRSDLTPLRSGPSDDQIKEALAKRAQQLGFAPEGKKRLGIDAGGATGSAGPGGSGRGGGGSAAKADDGGDDDDRFQDPDAEVGLFAGAIYDKEDEEADKVWGWVDERMDRRKRQREAREKAEKEEHERNNPKIQQQFFDLKRSLNTITDEEWTSLPEVGDLTRKNKRARQALLKQRYFSVPDSVLAAARDSSKMVTSVVDDGMSTTASASASNPDGIKTNFAKIGEARGKQLEVRLEQATQAAVVGGGESVIGTATSIDPGFYINRLNRMKPSDGQYKVGDITRVRELLQSVIKTNPTNALGWIAAARLEEIAGKPLAARKVIDQGCTRCPRSEDAWLENIRLNEGAAQSHNAKVIARRAIEANPRSVQLWVAAMQLEAVPRDRKRVIRQALDHVPESEALWKEAVNLEEDPADARLLLAKATELVPLSVDLWLALARLETPKNAQIVLRRARRSIPTSHEVWIAAARLQDQLGDQLGEDAAKANIMRNAVLALVKEKAMLRREEWIAEAERCEEQGAIVTCNNIIRETLGWGLDEDDDRKDTWVEEARASAARGRPETARAVYAYALRVFVNSKTVWTAAAELERTHGTRETLCATLERAVEACPKSEELWMMLAKERWLEGEIDGARRVLARAFKQNPNNEDIWLAAVKLEAENGQEDEARKLLELAREQAPTDRVWMKSVVFERVLGQGDAALALAERAVRLFPSAAKLWMLRGQLHEDGGQTELAHEAYAAGVRAASGSVPLWLLYARLEERAGQVVKARSVLDRARLAVPGSAEVWCEAVRLERRAGQLAQARTLVARALQELPRSGLLWSEQIWHLEPRTQQKPRSLEAVKRVDNDPVLLATVARIFWAERRLDKAQAWFEKALALDRDRGDTWAWYYAFLLQHGTAEKRTQVMAECVRCEPRHGEAWQAVAKEPANARARTAQVLELVAARIERMV